MKNLILSIGLVEYVLKLTSIVLSIESSISTRLYDPRALKELEDPEIFRKVYGNSSET